MLKSHKSITDYEKNITKNVFHQNQSVCENHIKNTDNFSFWKNYKPLNFL